MRRQLALSCLSLRLNKLNLLHKKMEGFSYNICYICIVNTSKRFYVSISVAIYYYCIHTCFVEIFLGAKICNFLETAKILEKMLSTIHEEISELEVLQHEYH